MFPRDRLVTDMAAKWTGSMPTDFAIGKRSAAERIFPETSSTSMPIRRRMMFSMSRTIHLFVVNSNINSVNCWGLFDQGNRRRYGEAQSVIFETTDNKWSMVNSQWPIVNDEPLIVLYRK